MSTFSNEHSALYPDFIEKISLEWVFNGGQIHVTSRVLKNIILRTESTATQIFISCNVDYVKILWFKIATKSPATAGQKYCIGEYVS